MKMHRLLIVSTLIISLVSGYSAYAEDNKSDTAKDSSNGQNLATNNEYDLQRCINEAIKNSLDIQLLEVQKENKELGVEEADFYKSELNKGQDEIEEAEDSLKQLKALYANLVSMGIGDNIAIPNIEVISGGKLQAGTTKAQIHSLIEKISSSIDKNYAKVADTLQTAQVKELMGTKANAELDVTNYAMEIAKTQIGLLVQNSFYDAVKNQKLTELKNSTLTRLNQQERLAEESYNSGMKSKDDMLLCQVLQQFARIDLLNSQRLTNVSLYELKKNMNIDLDTDIKLKDDIKADIQSFKLDEGISFGMLNRLEIRKANAEMLVAKLNFEVTKRYSPDYTFDYKDAEQKVKEAEINLKKVKLGIETDIRESYENLQKTEEMLNNTQGLYDKAKENVDLATEKYQMGFDFSSANLKDLNLEEAAGTIVDVTAAEEKLSEVNEKLVELIYNYNQAKAKYLYDIGNSYWF